MIWLRNVLINLLMLFPLAMLAVLAARLGVFFFNFLNADNVASVNWGWFFANTVPDRRPGVGHAGTRYDHFGAAGVSVPRYPSSRQVRTTNGKRPAGRRIWL